MYQRAEEYKNLTSMSLLNLIPIQEIIEERYDLSITMIENPLRISVKICDLESERKVQYLLKHNSTEEDVKGAILDALNYCKTGKPNAHDFTTQ